MENIIIVFEDEVSWHFQLLVEYGQSSISVLTILFCCFPVSSHITQWFCVVDRSIYYNVNASENRIESSSQHFIFMWIMLSKYLCDGYSNWWTKPFYFIYFFFHFSIFCNLDKYAVHCPMLSSMGEKNMLWEFKRNQWTGTKYYKTVMTLNVTRFW